MREDLFSLSLYTFADFKSESDFLKLWKVLLDIRFGATNFGGTEKTKHKLNSDSHMNLYEYYLESEDFFAKGNNSLFWLKSFTHNIYKITVYVYSKSDINNLILLFNDLANEIPLIYGFGRTSQEYQIKNETVEYFEGGGSARGAVGISHSEFLKYLPGVYSFTMFGTEIIEFFTRAKLESMKLAFPNLEYFEGNNCFGFRIDDESQSLGTVIQIQKEIAQYLGQEYFFDRDLVGNVNFKPVATVSEKIL